MKSEKRHVKEIIEDEETITIVYNKNEDFEGIKIKESDTPDEGPEETIEDPIEFVHQSNKSLICPMIRGFNIIMTLEKNLSFTI